MNEKLRIDNVKCCWKGSSIASSPVAALNLVSEKSAAGHQKVDLKGDGRNRLFVLIAVMWFLIKQIGPNSNWLTEVGAVINEKPNISSCPYSLMGFTDDESFPVHLFA